MEKKARQDLLREVREEIAQQERELAELRRIDAYLSRKCGQATATPAPATTSASTADVEAPRAEAVPAPKMSSSNDSKKSIRETRSWS